VRKILHLAVYLLSHNTTACQHNSLNLPKT
jgi:hypothetical protein